MVEYDRSLENSYYHIATLNVDVGYPGFNKKIIQVEPMKLWNMKTKFLSIFCLFNVVT